MNRKIVLAATIALLVAAVALIGSQYRFWTGPGQGGPENVVPARYWTGPGQGGPESVIPARWIMGIWSGGSVE